VTPAVAEYIRKLRLPGVHLRPEERRFYPTGEINAHLVGMTNIDGSRYRRHRAQLQRMADRPAR
jgi:cell division protein FtsI (penicillin-binding protein 3)